MAINITHEPQEWTPVYNEMRFVVGSTNTAQPNFRYVADIYVSGVAGYTRLTCDANVITGYGTFDISNVVQAHISHDIDHTVYGFQRCTNSYKPYIVRFGEQYGTTPVVYPNLQNTGTKYAWNASLDPVVLETYNYQNYTIGLGGTFLTQQPELQKFVASTEQRWLYFINDVSGSAYYLRCTTYDSAGNTLGTYLIENPYQASSSITQDKLLRVGVGVEDLNKATLASGSQPVIDSKVNKYEVALTNYADDNPSTSYYFERDCTARGQNPVEIVFLNELGGFDMYGYKYRRDITSTVEREFVEKNNGYLSGNSWNQDTINRGQKQVYTSATDTLNCTSELIGSESTVVWLRELIESPEVYWHNASYLIPVTVVDSNYHTIRYKVWDMLWDFKTSFRFANKRKRQQG